MTIAIVCSRLSYGGAERVAVLWANGFIQRGHKVILVSNLYEPVTYEVDKNVIMCQLVSNNNGIIRKWLSSFIYLRKTVKKFNPDVVIGIMSTCSFISRVATFGKNIPVISTEHDSFEKPVYPPFGKFRKFIMNRLYKDITVLTKADSYVIGDRLRRIHVLPNPLSLKPANDSIYNRSHIILSMGRLDAWYVKGFDVLIRAWGKIANSEELKVKRDGWKLQIAGTGSENNLNYLKQLCKENGVEKDIEKLYQKASIFVLSSRFEGFGLVLIEAMSQGCACVACDYKGRQKEILFPDGQVLSEKCKVKSGELHTEGCGDAELETRKSELEARNTETETWNSHVEVCETGILCEPDDVDALAEAMRKMITDDEYRESVRLNAIERSNYYSIENTIDRWELILDKVVHK